jgi:hypothetical protein
MEIQYDQWNFMEENVEISPSIILLLPAAAATTATMRRRNDKRILQC